MNSYLRLSFLWVVGVLCLEVLQAQTLINPLYSTYSTPESKVGDMIVVDSIAIKPTYNTWGTPFVRDEMTTDPEQNKKWKEGNAKFPSKPKNMWELGIHAGHFFINGDVNSTFPGGFGLGVHLRKALHYIFSIRLDAFYGQAYGLDPQPWGTALLPEQSVFAGYGPQNKWFPSYRTKYSYGALEGVLNLGNMLFHKERNKWNMNLIFGVGLAHNQTDLDLRDANGGLYTDLQYAADFNRDKFNSRQGRLDIKSKLREIYDGTYETPANEKAGVFKIADRATVNIIWITAFGISRKISKRLNIGIEHQIISSQNDYLDGITWRTNADQTNNEDISQYTTIRFGINLGSFDKSVEPLYWLNPLDAIYGDIADLKKRPILDLTDEDEDGILDMFDEELDTPKDALVDAKGRALDSDGDGVIDLRDSEPYSMAGTKVDKNGRSIISPDDRKTSVSDVRDLLDNRLVEFQNSLTTDWFLPMIHFDLDKYCIKPGFYEHMKQLATVMKANPDLCVSAYGHTDSRSPNDYNQVLSYNRAKSAIDFMVSNYDLDRLRFKLMYNGEESPLVSDSLSTRKETAHYMNRRVEFRVCKADDIDMMRPEGPEAGSCSTYDPTLDEYIKSVIGAIENARKKQGY